MRKTTVKLMPIASIHEAIDSLQAIVSLHYSVKPNSMPKCPLSYN